MEIFLLSQGRRAARASGSRWPSPDGGRRRDARIRFDEDLAAKVLEVHRRRQPHDRVRPPARRRRSSRGSATLPCRRTSAARPETRTVRRIARRTRPSSRASRSRSPRRRPGSTSPRSSCRRSAARGVEIADLTLAVGAGTFKPVTAEDTDDHVLAPEEVVLPASTRAAVARARSEGRRVVAVGTTVARSLEAAVRRTGDDPAGDLALRDRSLHHAGLRVPGDRRSADELPPAPLDAPDARLGVRRARAGPGRLRRGDRARATSSTRSATRCSCRALPQTPIEWPFHESRRRPMDRLPGGHPGRPRDDRAPEALPAADGLFRRAAAPARRFSLRLRLAERTGRPGRGAGDARLQLLLPAAALHLHDRRPAQRGGALRLPGFRPPDRTPVGALPPATRPRSRPSAATSSP